MQSNRDRRELLVRSDRDQREMFKQSDRDQRESVEQSDRDQRELVVYNICAIISLSNSSLKKVLISLSF